MAKPLVIYHAGCWDGFCAAWVARKALGDIEAVPAHYGSDPQTSRIAMCSFSISVTRVPC